MVQDKAATQEHAATQAVAPRRRSETWHRLVFALILAFLLLVIVLLPFALGSLMGYVLRPQSNRVYSLLGAGASPDPSHVRLHLDVLSVDEWGRSVQIRVSGNHICEQRCQFSDQVVFVASPESGDLAEGLPASDSVDLPSSGSRATQTITLPVVGQPVLFPFDTYRLGLGVMLHRVAADGSSQDLSENDARGRLFLSMQTHVSRAIMHDPAPESAQALGLETPGSEYVGTWAVTFERPAYLKILTILLVLLVVVAASYAVFLRPLAELVINAGALVLGVWGIRSILLGSSPPNGTLVDIALSMVIFFLLIAIATRALSFHRSRGDVRLRRRKPASPADDEP